MHRKKYWTLFPLVLLAFLYLYFNYPERIDIGFLVVILFWITYYSWIFIEKKLVTKKDDKSKPPDS
ncbi:hypothetical protein BA724_17575 [Domibacillus iocasae]|uniref:Uncharacterized protein n=1 Tax=Domibacillus iocasae TaxID=1714016 RepID=A0A1E7DQU6_9BACI|nr:hypothetical protein BA724_17575 [Domibacillus iocasae]